MTEDIEKLTDQQFLQKYKVTKELYKLLFNSFYALQNIHEELTNPEQCMEFKRDLFDNIEGLIGEFEGILEQAHMASEFYNV